MFLKQELRQLPLKLVTKTQCAQRVQLEIREFGFSACDAPETTGTRMDGGARDAHPREKSDPHLEVLCIVR